MDGLPHVGQCRFYALFILRLECFREDGDAIGDVGEYFSDSDDSAKVKSFSIWVHSAYKL